MAANDLINRVTVDPSICRGRPCIRGLRMPVETVLELLASRMSESEILSDYPDLEPNDIQACLVYAQRLSQVKTIVGAAP
jgi:uncharacterized protein (DUF433 family)